ncbi:MAG: glycerol-3-phosphate 1-O-acyltransferase PlsY [Clostridia bacterium]|nr:glycerol-3-phosphate 1-O-acyltransferase PlsY [Clostridia bacterium]
MLQFFMRYQTGYMGLIGSLWQNRTTVPELLLAVVYILIPYLLGSVNTAIIVSGKFYRDDIRNYGSGNAGFTNIMRIYGKRAAIFTFVGDFLKTVLAILIGWCCFGYLTATIAGFACFIGHIFPVFYQFRGGKGILCLTAMLFMLDWRIFLILLGIFLLVVGMTKYISFGSVLCSLLYPLLFNRLNQARPFTGMWICQILAILIAAIVVIKHWGNLKRIFEGTESKFQFKKSKKTAEEEAAEKSAEPREEDNSGQAPKKINYGALPGGTGGKKKK